MTTTKIVQTMERPFENTCSSKDELDDNLSPSNMSQTIQNTENDLKNKKQRP
jgi:hypothetical protein